MAEDETRSFTSSEGPPDSKKRKLLHHSESQLDSLKAENEKLKERNKLLQATTSNQVIQITQLKIEKQNGGENVNNIKCDPDNDKKLLQEKINELELSTNGWKTQYWKSNHESKLLQVQYNSMQSSNKKSVKKIQDLEGQLQDKSTTESFLRAKIAEMERNCDHQKKLHQTEIDQLKATVQDGNKSIDGLKSQLHFAKKNEEKLQSEIDKLTQLRATSNDQRIRANNSPRFVTLDEIRDRHDIIANRITCRNMVIINVAKVDMVSDQLCNVYATLDPAEIPVKVDLDSPLSCFQFRINDEIEIKSRHVDRFIRRIHSSTITKLDLGDTYIEYGQFNKLVSTDTISTFIGGNIGRQNGLGILGIDKILKKLPNIEICEMRYFGYLDDCRKLVQLPVFKNLKKFSISPNSLFNMDDFIGFVKKHPNVEFIFKINLLTETTRTHIRQNEKQFRKHFPSTCKVVIEY